MRRTLLACLLAGLFSGAAAASPVLVLAPGGHLAVRHERLGPGADLPAPPRTARPRPPRPAARAAGGRTIAGELRRLERGGAIDAAEYGRRRDTLVRTARTLRGLTGFRRVQLAAVLDDVGAIAARGGLTASRLAPLFLTLERNREWWTSGPLLAIGQRVGFTGSGLVWQHYANQGIQLQMLANFGKANGLWQAHLYGEMRGLLDELVPLAARRGRGIAWEYYFPFGGGRPGWTSAISQGDALQALGRATKTLHDYSYRLAGQRALALFTEPPPTGVRERTRSGARYIIYTFAPRYAVINAFLHAVTGLFDFARLTRDAGAERLYSAGDAEARREVPAYDTGAWSLYSPGEESDLSYHQLVEGFLGDLCRRTQAAVYCDTQERFARYEHEPPRLAGLSRHARVGASGVVAFRVSKISRVGVEVLRGGQILLSTSATFARGAHRVGFVAPRRTGKLSVRLTATDPSGNVGRAGGVIDVAPAKHVAPAKR